MDKPSKRSSVLLALPVALGLVMPATASSATTPSHTVQAVEKASASAPKLSAAKRRALLRRANAIIAKAMIDDNGLPKRTSVIRTHKPKGIKPLARSVHPPNMCRVSVADSPYRYGKYIGGWGQNDCSRIQDIVVLSKLSVRLQKRCYIVRWCNVSGPRAHAQEGYFGTVPVYDATVELECHRKNKTRYRIVATGYVVLMAPNGEDTIDGAASVQSEHSRNFHCR